MWVGESLCRLPRKIYSKIHFHSSPASFSSGRFSLPERMERPIALETEKSVSGNLTEPFCSLDLVSGLAEWPTFRGVLTFAMNVPFCMGF